MGELLSDFQSMGSHNNPEQLITLRITAHQQAEKPFGKTQ
jgi:hypothetical protein